LSENIRWTELRGEVSQGYTNKFSENKVSETLFAERFVSLQNTPAIGGEFHNCSAISRQKVSQTLFQKHQTFASVLSGDLMIVRLVVFKQTGKTKRGVAKLRA